MDLIQSATALLDPPSVDAEPPEQLRSEDAYGIAPESAPPPPSASAPAGEAPPPIAPSVAPRVAEVLAAPPLLDALLRDYLHGQLQLHQLAPAHDLSVVDLVAILDAPPIARILDDLTRHAAIQAHRLAILARPQAIEKLQEIITADPAHHRLLPPALHVRSRESIRKAAALIERISKPPKAGGGGTTVPAARRHTDTGSPTVPARAAPQPQTQTAAPCACIRPESPTRAPGEPPLSRDAFPPRTPPSTGATNRPPPSVQPESG